MLLAGHSLALNDGLGPPPEGVDRDTPLAAVEGFNAAAHEGDYARAAHYLFLDHLPKAEQAKRGPALARKLRFVLDRELPIDFAALARKPEPDAPAARGVLVGVVRQGTFTQPVRLQRVVVGSSHAWVFGEDTVRAIDAMYERIRPPLADALPDFFFERSAASLELWQWIGAFLLVVLATALSLLLERLFLALGGMLANLTSVRWDDDVVASARGPLRLLLWAGAVAVGTRTLLLLPKGWQTGFDVLAKSLVIAALVWFLVRVLRHLARHVETRVSPDVLDPRARALRTQVEVMRRIAEVAVWLVGAALFLMQFEVVRNVGVSLLASAGIAGLVLGLAAQRSISSIIAGIQISVTQPIRLGDAVVVENEFGFVEEIRLTYVVVRVWDGRRLVLPIATFLDKPFQNWTRSNPELLGVVFLHVDFTADVDAIRAELKRVLETDAGALWDKRAFGLQVTDVTSEVMTLRAVMSAADPARSWDLRCLVRERLMHFLKQRPEWLPTRRSVTKTLADQGGA